MKADINQIKTILRSHTDFLKETYHIENVGIFGSVARGENTDISDIDILVEFSEPIGMFTFIKLEDYLSKLIGVNVDLVTKNALKPAIRDDVLQEVEYV